MAVDERSGPPAATRPDEGVATIEVEVLSFARARELLGGRSAAIRLPAGSTVADCLDVLRERHAAIDRLLPILLVAVNEAYADRDQPLRQGDTVALIPPVSGG